MEKSHDEFVEWAKSVYLGKVIDESIETNINITRYIYIYDVLKGNTDSAFAYLVGIEVVEAEGAYNYMKRDFTIPLSSKTLLKFAKKKDFDALISKWYDAELLKVNDNRKFVSKIAKIRWNKK